MTVQVGAAGALLDHGREVGTFEVVRVQSSRRVRVRACCREETFELPAVLADLVRVGKAIRTGGDEGVKLAERLAKLPIEKRAAALAAFASILQVFEG